MNLYSLSYTNHKKLTWYESKTNEKVKPIKFPKGNTREYFNLEISRDFQDGAQKALIQFSSVQPLSCVRLFVTPWITARQASLSITNSRSSLRLTSIESVMPSNHLILCHPLLLPPSIFSRNQGLFQWVNSSHEVAKVLEFQLQHQSFQWTPGLISFRIDWLDILAVQGTLKSLLQHHSSKASILRHSAFFTVQLSHPYMTTGKTIALTRWAFVGKLMSLLCNKLPIP